MTYRSIEMIQNYYERGLLEPIPLLTGRKAGNTLDSCQSIAEHTHRHIHINEKDTKAHRHKIIDTQTKTTKRHRMHLCITPQLI